MKLTIMERVVILPKIYPESSGIVEQILVKQITEKIIISEAEMKKVGMKTEKYKTEEGEEKVFTAWKDDKYEKDIDFSGAEIQLLKTQVKELDRTKQIKQDMLSLCLKINSYELLDKGGKK